MYPNINEIRRAMQAYFIAGVDTLGGIKISATSPFTLSADGELGIDSASINLNESAIDTYLAENNYQNDAFNEVKYAQINGTLFALLAGALTQDFNVKNLTSAQNITVGGNIINNGLYNGELNLAGNWLNIGKSNAANSSGGINIFGQSNSLLSYFSYNSINDIWNTNKTITSTAADAFRMVKGNYGAFWRNSGAGVYLMLTASGDQYGTYNSLRPFSINNVTGLVSMGNSLNLGDTINFTSNAWVTQGSISGASNKLLYTATAGHNFKGNIHSDRNITVGEGVRAIDTTGKHLDLYYNPTYNQFVIQSYDRDAAKHLDLQIYGDVITHIATTSHIFKNGSTGVATLFLDRQPSTPTIKALGDSTNNKWLMIDSSGEYLSLNHYCADNVVLAIGGGNVGIGAIPSTYKLDVLSTDSGIVNFTSSNGGNFSVDKFGNTKQVYQNKLKNYLGTDGTNQAGIHYIYDSNTVRKISLAALGNSYFNGGYVGFGTDTPLYQVHVKNTGASFGSVVNESTNSSYGAAYYLGNDKLSTAAYLILYGSTHSSLPSQLALKNNYGEIAFFTGTNNAGTEKMRILPNGNIGINNTAINNWHTAYNAIDFPFSSIMYSNIGNELQFVSNAYYDGVWKYKATGAAADYRLNTGTHTFRVAGSGSANAALTWINALQINAAGTVFGSQMVKGFTGAGWGIEADGAMYVKSLEVRESLRVYTLEVEELKVSTGSQLFTAGVEISQVGTNSFYYENKNYDRFSIGDILRCQQWNGSNSGDIIKFYQIRVTNVGESTTITQSDGKKARFVTYTDYVGSGTGVVEGDMVAKVGNIDILKSSVLEVTSRDGGFVQIANGITATSGVDENGVSKASFHPIMTIGNVNNINYGNDSIRSGVGYGLASKYLLLDEQGGNIAGWAFNKNTLEKITSKGSISLQSDFGTNSDRGRISISNAGSYGRIYLGGQLWNSAIQEETGISFSTDYRGAPHFQMTVNDNTGVITSQIAGWVFDTQKIYQWGFWLASNNSSLTSSWQGTPAGHNGIYLFKEFSGYADRTYVNIGETYSAGWTGRYGFSLTPSKNGAAHFEFSRNLSTGALISQIAGWNFNSSEIYKSFTVSSQTSKVRLGDSIFGNTTGTYAGFAVESADSLSDISMFMHTSLNYVYLIGRSPINGVRTETFRLATTGSHIANWKFDNEAFYNSTNSLKYAGTLNTSGIELNQASKQIVLWANTITKQNYIKQWITSSTDWGIKGVVKGETVFSLGTTNQIAGWNITSTAIYTQSDSGGRNLYISNSDDVQVAPNQHMRGFTVYNADAYTVDGGIKICRIGSISPLNTYNISTTNKVDGIQIGINKAANYKDIFRVDSTGAMIAGWKFDNEAFYNSTNSLKYAGTLNTSGIELNQASKQIVLWANTITKQNYIKQWITSSTDWGIKGVVNNETIFQLGTVTKIANWDFDASGIFLNQGTGSAKIWMGKDPYTSGSGLYNMGFGAYIDDSNYIKMVSNTYSVSNPYGRLEGCKGGNTVFRLSTNSSEDNIISGFKFDANEITSLNDKMIINSGGVYNPFIYINSSIGSTEITTSEVDSYYIYNNMSTYCGWNINNINADFRIYYRGTDNLTKGQFVVKTDAYGTDINIKSLPTSASGLNSGSVWRDGTTLKIVI